MKRLNLLIGGVALSAALVSGFWYIHQKNDASDNLEDEKTQTNLENIIGGYPKELEVMFQNAIADKRHREPIVALFKEASKKYPFIEDVVYSEEFSSDVPIKVIPVVPRKFENGRLTVSKSKIEINPEAFSGSMFTVYGDFNFMMEHELNHARRYADPGDNLVDLCVGKNSKFESELYGILDELSLYKVQIERCIIMEENEATTLGITPKFGAVVLRTYYTNYQKLKNMRKNPNLKTGLIDILLEEFYLPHLELVGAGNGQFLGT